MEMAVGSCGIVRYDEHFGMQEFVLLEVDQPLLSELHSSRLTLKGGSEDEAVLCTLEKTYAVKYVSTSNTMLIVPPTSENKIPEDGGNEMGVIDAVATCSGHLELVEVAPRLDKLKQLVCSRPYSEEEEELENSHELCSWKDLLNQIQASEKELKEGLKAVGAAEIGGYWRTVEPKFTQSLIEIITLTAVQHDWQLQALPFNELISALEEDGYGSEIVSHCLATFAARNESNLWAFDEKKVCIHYAKQLLSKNTRWKMDDFLTVWQKSLPRGIMMPKVEMLKGEVLVEKMGSDAWIRYFSSGNLSLKPSDRFAALFKERQKWEWEDLEPYLKELKVPGQSVEAMLLKYTRKTQPTPSSRPIYTPR